VSILPIETERLRIHHFTADDWRAVHAYTSNPGVMTYLPEDVMTEEQTRQFVAESMTEDARAYAVDLRAEDQLIGHISFHPWFAPRIYEIGWVFHPRYQGRGYATEARPASRRTRHPPASWRSWACNERPISGSAFIATRGGGTSTSMRSWRKTGARTRYKNVGVAICVLARCCY
jgi:hypothetical protein